MDAASPTAETHGTDWLDDHHISALSGCIADILEQISPRIQSDTDACDAISSVIAAARSACARFAGGFNDRNPHALTTRLPGEVLTSCLYMVDIPTRVRASHISRAWRAIALSERGLWTDYCWKSFPQLRSSLDFLEAALHRSDPLPFRLQLPDIYSPQHDSYVSRLVTLITPRVCRMQAYEGPGFVLEQLNSDGVPLLELVSVDIIGDNWRAWSNVFPDSPARLPPCLPNLRRLTAPVLDLQGQYFPNLQVLQCAVNGYHSEYLFRHCPNLVRAIFYGWKRDSRLPRGPVPRTIREIDICGYSVGNSGLDGIDFAALRAWAGECIPKLTLSGAKSLEIPVRELLAAHSVPSSLTVSTFRLEPDIVFTDAADPSRWRWAVSTQSFWGSSHCGRDLQQLFSSVQIVSLTLCMERLDMLLSARPYAPHLLSLELKLTHVEYAMPSELHSLRAPKLQHFSLDLGETDSDVRVEEIHAALEELGNNFRRLILYDAELLETVSMRLSARTPAGTEGASFARFARRYVELKRR